MISKSGAGPPPMPGKTVTANQLAAAFDFVHQPETQAAALKISTNFQNENGCEVAVRSFHAYLPVDKMRSDLDSTFGACFQLEKYNLQISRPVAQVLLTAELIEESDLSPLSVYGWYTLMHDGHFKVIKRGFRRAVSKITESMNHLKRSRSLSATDRKIIRTTENRTKHEVINIGRPFKDCLPLYGEIKQKSDDKQCEKENSEQKVRHSVHYGLTLLVEKAYDNNEQHTTVTTSLSRATSSSNKNSPKSRSNNHSITRELSKQNKNKNDQQTNRTNQRSIISKDKNNNKSCEEKAAEITGLSIEICREILSKFKEIKPSRRHSHDHDRSPHRIRIPHGLHRTRSRTTDAN